MRPLTHPGDDPRRVLDRVLLSPYFQTDNELSEILLYICYQTQSGNLQALHEHDIGVAVLGMEPGYDVSEDRAVAEAVDQIRERLKLYFANEGRRESFRVTIPKGEFRAFFYEADPRELAAAAEPTALERFWAPYWQNSSRNLLVHGELPGETMRMAEAYAVTRIAVLFAENQSLLQMRPVSAVEEEDLRQVNLILLGDVETNALMARYVDAPDQPVIERLWRDTTHGVITAITAPDSEGLLTASRFVCDAEHLAKHEFPPMFRLRLSDATVTP